MVLVNIWCKAKGCGRWLGPIEEAPAQTEEMRWNGMFRVNVCPWHDPIRPRGNVDAWSTRTGNTLQEARVDRWVHWADIRAAVAKARRTGKTQNHAI